MLVLGLMSMALAAIEIGCWLFGQSLIGSGANALIFILLGVLSFMLEAPTADRDRR